MPKTFFWLSFNLTEKQKSVWTCTIQRDVGAWLTPSDSRIQWQMKRLISVWNDCCEPSLWRATETHRFVQARCLSPGVISSCKSPEIRSLLTQWLWLHKRLVDILGLSVKIHPDKLLKNQPVNNDNVADSYFICKVEIHILRPFLNGFIVWLHSLWLCIFDFRVEFH